MKISDFDIYHLPPLMGMFVDYIENECERLLQESPQFTEANREKTMSYWTNTHS